MNEPARKQGYLATSNQSNYDKSLYAILYRAMKLQVGLTARQLLFTLLFCLTGGAGWAQRINAITFDKLPQDYQLYPRNAQNEAQIPISGRVGEPGWQSVSVQVFRNKQAIGYRRAAINYTGEVGRFTVEPITIRAEKAEYSIKLHLVKGTDSTHVVERINLVAGDVYVFTGQSNASAYFKETRMNEFCRTFGKTSGTYGADPGSPADTAWAVSNQQLITQNVGTFGFEFQQLILEKYGIPTCLINGATHWSMMAHHATRTASNPADLTNPYGRLLYRLQKGGLDKAVKALVYRQGESEAYGEGNSWGSHFDVFYKNVKLDLPSIDQLYVYQIDIIDPAVAAAPLVRETQRALVNKYLDVQVLASIGTSGFDGLHYSDAGYAQNAQELFRLIDRDFYKATDVDNIDAPNIRRAYYTTEARTEITLRFNEGQELVWPAQVGNRQLKDVFYVDGREGEVTAGRAAGNRIILTLKNPSSATRLTYLPPKIDPGAPEFPYRGPYLTNRRGLRALSFYELPIGSTLVPPLPMPALTVVPASEFAMQLSWNAVAGATSYLLEIKDPESGTFRTLRQLSAGTLTYLASGLSDNTAYSFRVQAVGIDTESPWNQVEARTPALLKTPEVQGEATFATAVALSWQPVREALGYVVERRGAQETGFTSLTTVSAAMLSFTDKLVAANSTYTYRVKATGRYTDSPFGVANAQTPALLARPELAVGVVYNNALQLNWTPVPDATGYQVIRKAPNGSSQDLGTFSATTTAIKDTNLLTGTTYTYQLKAVGSRTESPVVSTSATTPALLDLPTLSPEVVYNNALKVSWKAVPNAERYELERKTADQAFQKIGTFKPDMLTVSDTNLVPGTRYLYRVRALGRYSESLVATATVETPAILAAPALSLTVVYNNALTVNWNAVPNAIAYQLERRTAVQAYQPVGTFKPDVLLFQDADLTPGTTYAYRLTAIGDKTISPTVSTSAVTPELLTTPNLLVTPISYDVISLTWTASPNATHYLLERKVAGAGTYESMVKVEASQNQYTDTRLTPSTEYQYRLTAYGDKTQSSATVAAGTTLILLAVEPDPTVTLRLWPNPATGGQVSLHFSAPVSGRLQLLDLRGIVQLEQEVANANQVPLSVTGYPAGIYMVRLIRATDIIVQKLLVH